MLDEFVTTNRSQIIARTRAKVMSRSEPRPSEAELRNGVPLFLDQLVVALGHATRNTEAIGAGGAVYGGNLLKLGFTIAQVVRDYGDVCQAVTELADELEAPITTDEFHTLNLCLDEATAEAVTEYARMRDRSQRDEERGRLGALAHELRNKLGSATLAFTMLKEGRVAIGGSTGAVLERNLRGLRDLINRSLTEVRLDAGPQHRERIVVSELIEEIEIDASLEAKEHGISLFVAPVPAGVELEADRPIVAAALTNLLQNAFKFSRARGHVSLTTTVTGERVRFDIEDSCGGLPPGQADELFHPFSQKGANRVGLGLGLSISRRGIEANGGQVGVRDLPGQGCVFTIELPLYAAP